MSNIRNDPRRALPVAAPGGKYRIDPEQRLFDPESGHPLHGTLIGNRYELIREIGRGGSCICYHAFDRENGVFVALKEWFPISLAQEGLLDRQGDTLALTTAGKNDEAKIREKFERDFAPEAKLVRKQQYVQQDGQVNNDPNAFAVKPLQTGPWMQYLVIGTEAGTPLNQVDFAALSHEARLVDILECGLQIAARLDWLHSEKQLLHCDLKPENIYVSSLHTGEKEKVSSHVLRLIDYGSGFPLDSDAHVRQESITHLSFSTAYAAPELLALRDEDRWEDAVEKLSPATDIYSALRIMLELLAPEADPEELCSSDLWDSSLLQHLPEPVIEHFCDFFEGALSIKRLHNAEELKAAIVKLKELIKCSVSVEWLRYRSEACAKQQLSSNRLFPIAVWRSFGEQQSLSTFSATLPHMLILTGLAGAGKTTVMGQLASRLLKQEKYVPLQIPLREFDGSPYFVRDWILYKILKLKTAGKADEWNRQQLMELFFEDEYCYYLLLDGYDEIPYPDAICQELEELSQCPGVRLVVSSRYVPKNSLFESQFEHAKICPLSKSAINAVLAENGLPGGDDERFLTMLSTPLWLRLYLGLPNNGQEAPRTSGELMRRHIEYLKEKAAHNPLVWRREGFLPLIQETMDVLFPRFCWLMTKQKCLSFDARQAKDMLVQSVKELDAADAFDPMRRDAIPETSHLTARVVRDVLISFALAEEQNGTYVFAHALFRDYFAAREILRQLRGKPLPQALSVGPLTETVAVFLAEMEEVHPEALMDVHCRGRRGAEYAMVVRNLVEILKLRHEGDLSGTNLSDIDLTVTDLVGYDLSRNGEASANLSGSLLSDRTFDAVSFDHICGEPPFPIPSARQVAIQGDKQTVFLDMDTLCVLRSIPVRFTQFYLWDGCVWGVEASGLALWKMIPGAIEPDCIPLQRPTDLEGWTPHLLINGKLYLSANLSQKKSVFDLATETLVPLEEFPAEAEVSACAAVRSCTSEGWHMAGTGVLLYRVQESDLYLLDAIMKEELCLRNLPRDIISSVRMVYRDGESISILTFSGKLLLVNGERQERITLNRIPLVHDFHVTEDGLLEAVSTQTRSRWALKDGKICRKDGGLTKKIDYTAYSGYSWWLGAPITEKTPAGILEAKGLSEPGMAVLTYSPTGKRKTQLLLSGVDALFPLGNGTMAIKRRREVCMEIYGPDSEDTTRLAGRFMHPTGEVFPPDAVVCWNDALALYYRDSVREGFGESNHKSRIYYVTGHKCQGIPFADLLVKGCDLTGCHGLSEETKKLLKLYGAGI